MLINTVLYFILAVFQCIMLWDIRRYLKGIDSGQEETNEYLSDIRKMNNEIVNVSEDIEQSNLEKLTEFMGV